MIEGLNDKPKFVQPNPEKKGIPNLLERQTKELADLPEEFVIADIGDLFEIEGYDKKKIIENAYHDIYNLIKNNKIIYIEGTKPKTYKIIHKIPAIWDKERQKVTDL